MASALMQHARAVYALASINEEIDAAATTYERLRLLINSEGLSVEGAKSPLRSPKTAGPSDSSGKLTCGGALCFETRTSKETIEHHPAHLCPRYNKKAAVR